MKNYTGLSDKDLKILAINALHEIGVPVSLYGYFYLQEALVVAAKDIDVVFNITKAVYNPIAKKYNTTPHRVREAIRTAIEVAWDRGDLDTLQRFFGFTVSNTKGKPTNTEFIALVAECMRHFTDKDRSVALWLEELSPQWSAFTKQCEPNSAEYAD